MTNLVFPVTHEQLDEWAFVAVAMLGMGEDNYARLCRVEPDPVRRHNVVRARLERQLRRRWASVLDKEITSLLNTEGTW